MKHIKNNMGLFVQNLPQESEQQSCDIRMYQNQSIVHLQTDSQSGIKDGLERASSSM